MADGGLRKVVVRWSKEGRIKHAGWGLYEKPKS